MKQLIKIGRLFYSIGIIALGAQQIIFMIFRPEILSPFPDWAHRYTFFPILTGTALILAGIVISELVKIRRTSPKSISLYLGFGFLLLIITSHLPYILILSPYKASRLDVWFGAAEALAYCGGALVVAGSFSEPSLNGASKNFLKLQLEKIIPTGRILYAILIILFGLSHFVFTAFVSTMVPEWLGMRLFWTYFVGVALIGSGIAIVFKIWIKPIAFLLAVMLFLFLTLFHVPLAIAKPSVSNGDEIVRAFIALLFCGIALVVAYTNTADNENPVEP